MNCVINHKYLINKAGKKFFNLKASDEIMVKNSTIVISPVMFE